MSIYGREDISFGTNGGKTLPVPRRIQASSSSPTPQDGRRTRLATGTLLTYFMATIHKNHYEYNCPLMPRRNVWRGSDSVKNIDLQNLTNELLLQKQLQKRFHLTSLHI